MTRTLVVNADDFGRSAGITRGIVRAHVEGIVTSTSLMVRYPEGTGAAAAAAVAHPDLDVGLHLDLAEWEHRDGEWHRLYEVVPVDDPRAVERELAAQLACFREILGREPTHIDSHQHVHRDEPVRAAVVRAGLSLGVPVRHFSSVRYCGAFYGQGRKGTPLPDGITPDALAGLVHGLAHGATELACHPAATIDIPTDYAADRLTELEALCDPRVRAAVADAGVELRGFGALAAVSGRAQRRRPPPRASTGASAVRTASRLAGER
jgi:predicted glycoside hydrolase/deacetylase ChbG (UPF0249 family)